MRELITKSLLFDVKLLLIRRVPLRVRISFVLQKWRSLVSVAVLGRSSRIRVGPIDFEVCDISGLGTLQSNIIDFNDDIVHLDALPRDPVIVDAGANIGQFCSAVKLLYPDAIIHSFEPDPATHVRLLRNTRHMSGVTTYQVGLSNRAARVPFFRAPLSTMSSFVPDGGEASLELEVDRLDAVLDASDTIDVLKIDVEGLEYDVLEGAQGILDRVRWLIVEVSLGRNRHRSNLQLLRLITNSVPDGRLLKTGRPLGDPRMPSCQDFVFDLRSTVDRGRT